ncbi:unnamed protein product [Clonostachys solani]|uniref:Uncharacterized protein n=1 Tax=Clonostachys solani TaxID=160281 RepID=A0A9N9ZL68_9HYPO|nr:unnamed protein product [Clonostachys solani]
MGNVASKDGNDGSCPHHDLTEDSRAEFVGGFSFHEFSMILSGACCGITLLVMVFFTQMHATHLSNPTEQIKIMKIGSLISTYALVSFFSVAFPAASVYMHPWLDVIEGTALGSFFLLLCDYISPSQEQREAFFATKPKCGIRWFKLRWLQIFQFPIIALVLAIITNATAATGAFCEWRRTPGSLNFWIRLIGSISLVMAMVSILQVYGATKVDLAHHRPLAKLFAFKAVVGLTFLQTLIFYILTSTNTLKETDTLTFADVNIGIPNLIVSIEMIPLSIFFLTAYPWSVYLIHNSDGKSSPDPQNSIQYSKPYQGGPLGIYAWMYMLSPIDELKAAVFAVLQFFTNRVPQRGSDSHEMEHVPLAYQGQRMGP